MLSARSTFQAAFGAPSTLSSRVSVLIVLTHPIQYISPWLRRLAQDTDLQLRVVYLRTLTREAQAAGFGNSFEWDVPLREGYQSDVLDVATGLTGAWKLVSYLRRASARVIVVTGWQEPLMALAIGAARMTTKTTVIVRGESNALRVRGLPQRIFHRLLLRFAHGAVVIGRSNRDFYRKATNGRIRCFDGAYFVENERFLAMADARAETSPERAGASVTEFVFCGKHVPFKRPELLIEAAELLLNAGQAVRLRFAGSGELTPRLKERCVAGNIDADFIGFVNQTEMWKAYAGADVFVLPSTSRETWGLVVNEAMLFGLPAIVGDQVGCGPDLIIEGETGWVFSGGADGLAEAMLKAIDNRHRLYAMGQRAREHVRANYSMEVATAGLKQAIEALVPRVRD